MQNKDVDNCEQYSGKGRSHTGHTSGRHMAAVQNHERYASGAASGALLDMLAEVATQTLELDSSIIHSSSNDLPNEHSGNVSSPVCHLPSLSTKRLLETFARFDGDEMKRSFTFTCLFNTSRCQQSFFSFGSEYKARQLMKSHLLMHLQQERRQADVSLPFAVKKRTKKTHPSRKRQESTSESIPVAAKRRSKVNVKKHKASENKARSSEPRLSPSPISDEHNYTRTLDSELTPAYIKQEHGTEDNIARFMLGEANGNAAMVAYLDSNEVRLTQLPHVGKEVFINTTVAMTSTLKTDDELPPENVGDLMPCDNKLTHAWETSDTSLSKKPRAKTKLIGQSKYEKDEALRLMEEAKLKGSSAVCLECHICSPTRHFTALTTLISHYRSHAGIKPFECMICGQAFTRQHSLNYHLLIHSNLTRFTCAECGRKFRHPSHFKEHQRRHTGESPYQCEDCAFRFKTRNTYKRHMKTRHGKDLTTSGGVVTLSSKVTPLLPSNSASNHAECSTSLATHDKSQAIGAKQEIDKENDKSDFSSKMNSNIAKLSIMVKSNNSSIGAFRDIRSDVTVGEMESCSTGVQNDDNNNKSAYLSVPFNDSAEDRNLQHFEEGPRVEVVFV